MSFRRTNAGISNLYLFLGVDAIVFVEGGDTSYSLAELEKGLFNDQAEDLKYWGIIFRTFEPAKTFHLRAVGSKNSLVELAELVSSAKIKRVLVAMDRDFQNLTGELKSGPGVIYTSGYSWENDVRTPQVVFETFRKFNTKPHVEVSARQRIGEAFSSLTAKLRCCVRADAVLAFNRHEPLPRAKLVKVVRPDRTAPPTVALDVVRKLIKEQRTKIRPRKAFGPKSKIMPLIDCYGHLLGAYGYFLLVHILRTFCGIRVSPKELLIPAAIDTFSASLPSNSQLKSHYSAFFSQIDWSTQMASPSPSL